MFKLSFITFLALFEAFNMFSQTSPHGEKLDIKCDVCHNNKNWTTIEINKDSFNHNNTVFPLVGQHQTVTCKKCHIDLNFENTKTDCNSCHLDVHQQTVGNDCERCHTPTSWIVKNITQIHNQTRFPLQGSHASLDCTLCHKSASLLRYDPMGTECSDCHSTEYYATTNPSHVASKFPKDCFLCHNENNWQSTTFNHNNTAFPLTGAHVGIDCNQCHAKGYNVIPITCVSCHLTAYNETTNPNHVTAKFATTCETCHTTTAWVPSTFNHSTSTTFPLTGAHTGLDCTLCHPTDYNAIPTTCVSCHLTTYNATTNPNHAAAKFATTCETCHTTTAWVPSTFNHNTATTFPLTGAHIGLACALCHPTNYNTIPTTCVSCHLTTYNATTNPNHAGANFPTTCETCHSTANWTSSSYNHTTYFPISSGNHNVSCSTCHTNSTNYAVFTCVTAACHKTAHNQSQGSAGCYSCHPTGRS